MIYVQYAEKINNNFASELPNTVKEWGFTGPSYKEGEEYGRKK